MTLNKEICKKCIRLFSRNFDDAALWERGLIWCNKNIMKPGKMLTFEEALATCPKYVEHLAKFVLEQDNVSK